MIAPVQVVVIGLHQATFSGEVVSELRRLDEAGIVRLIDLLVVTHAADGGLITVDLPADAPVGLGDIAGAFLARSGNTSGTDAHQTDPTSDGDAASVHTWSLTDVVAPGTTAAVALLEHLWAAPLRAAMERGGDTPLEESWLSAHDLRMLEKIRQEATAKA